MIVVECSAVPTSRPAVFGSENAPARPGMPPGGPGLSGPVRPAVLRCSVLASASANPAAAAAWESCPRELLTCRSAASAWRTARTCVAVGRPRGSRCTTATPASSGKPNSLLASASACAAGDPGGISSDSPPVVAFSGGRKTMAAAPPAAHPAMIRSRRPTTTAA